MEKSNPINNNRRKALLGISGGAVAIWHKPMISSVILPAHAITSDLSLIHISEPTRPY